MPAYMRQALGRYTMLQNVTLFQRVEIDDIFSRKLLYNIDLSNVTAISGAPHWSCPMGVRSIHLDASGVVGGRSALAGHIDFLVFAERLLAHRDDDRFFFSASADHFDRFADVGSQIAC